VDTDLDAIYHALGFYSPLIERSYRFALKHVGPDNKRFLYKRILANALSEITQDPHIIAALFLQGLDIENVPAEIFPEPFRSRILEWAFSFQFDKFNPELIVEAANRTDEAKRLLYSKSGIDRFSVLPAGQTFKPEQDIYSGSGIFVQLGHVGEKLALQVTGVGGVESYLLAQRGFGVAEAPGDAKLAEKDVPLTQDAVRAVFAAGVLKLLQLNDEKVVREIWDQIQRDGFEAVERRLRVEWEALLTAAEEALNEKLRAELRQLAADLEGTPEWTAEYLRERLASALDIYVADEESFGHFTRLVYLLRSRLEAYARQEASRQFTFTAEEEAETASRLDRMAGEDSEAFQRALDRVRERIESVLNTHKAVRSAQEVDAVLGYDSRAAPPDREGFARLANSGELHYYHPEGQLGVFEELLNETKGLSAIEKAELSRIVGHIRRHPFYKQGISPLQVPEVLRRSGAFVVSDLERFESGAVGLFETGRLILYLGRDFDERRLRLLAETVDRLAQKISQGNAVTNAALLNQLADYGFVFKKVDGGTQLIFVDRAAFIAQIEREFVAVRALGMAA